MKVFWLSGTALSVLALIIAAAVPMPIKLIYNGSESAPLGFYWIDHQAVNRHDYVLVQVPKHVRDLVKNRQYLPFGIPLIKSVVGVSGDTVCRNGLEIIINTVTVAVARNLDKKGRALPNWQGCHVLTAGDVFLLQDHHLSFDGRYFGPVKPSLIIGRALKLWVPW